MPRLMIARLLCASAIVACRPPAAGPTSTKPAPVISAVAVAPALDAGSSVAPAAPAEVAAEALDPPAGPAAPDAPDDAPIDEAFVDSFPIDKITFGPLHLGMTEAQAVKIVGKPKTRPLGQLMGAIGDYEAFWEFDHGVLLKMSADTPKGPYHVSSIQLDRPSQWKTPAGIGIGSSRADVAAVYGKYFGRVSDASQILVGSVYYGLLFTVENDRVISAFLGPMAF